MGSDIEFLVEVRQEDDTWNEVISEGKRADCSSNNLLYWRNYSVFAVLANVRNRYGITPIAQPRDLPRDVSSSVKRKLSWHIDISYVSLEELLNYDWDQGVSMSGLVEEPLYRDFRANDLPMPVSWCSGAYGANIAIIQSPAYDNLVNGNFTTSPTLAETFSRDVYIDARWNVTVRDLTYGELWDYTIPKMKELHKDPARVRAVFGFDQ